ncbi:hypothetical protein SAMD00019534_049950 [Acytostelium subglobosum LB1]|uniref:hypothetical protein n=1 Tax=Acytostelium subglobosum LB1 TaxID=1410327 RepID=UPI000644D81C|nr:hypothetical protein SAMD00019534_049950 [Acytostelium subglobosum LB1]GAM21820.1 hypothetical protein SAMD00019534_049950 [Acytostelium subglobosum LB1]|eukprot:XP_012754920.1 hypothetical protein SAMD00019534_049950 [Acytostelium subglobosum LB1]
MDSGQDIIKRSGGIKNAIIQSIFSGSLSAPSLSPSSGIDTITSTTTSTSTTSTLVKPAIVEAEEDDATADLKSSTSKKRTTKQKTEDIDYDLLETLTPEQERVVNLIVDGKKNVFFTGSAGTGKSFVLKHIVARLREKHEKAVYVTAATGIAAVNIGGVTLHSFAGIKMGHGTPEQLVSKILKSRIYTKRWTEAKVLVIDEISMVDAELFEKLDVIARTLKVNDKPFGGIQLVLCGDFFQLPPVVGSYAFECEAWKRCVDECVQLTTVMRQKEGVFVKVLNNLRRGYVTPEAIKVLQDCDRPLDISNGVLPTKLYSTNQHVDDENTKALEALEGEPTTFTSIDSGSEELKDNIERDCPAPQQLTLKVGAQVVLLRKLDGAKSHLVNGSRGVVVDFVQVKPKKRMAQWYKANTTMPVVLFNDGSKVTIKPLEWNIWSERRASRTQLPLKLAWALTIHRAQGMTLDKVECRLPKTFANGQGYVALSRVKTLDGLCLHEFSRASIRTSYKVIQFEKTNLRPALALANQSPPTPVSYTVKF